VADMPASAADAESCAALTAGLMSASSIAEWHRRRRTKQREAEVMTADSTFMLSGGGSRI
jgi:hypothetical protein